LEAAVKILSMGNFRLEFGDLLRRSVVGYGIQQFFLKGGTEAYIVKVA
jgi:hypothetical protein